MIRPALVLLALTICCLAQVPAPAQPGQFPALKVQLGIDAQHRPDGGSYYRKAMKVEPKMTIEGSSRLIGVPATEATLLIVTMDSQAKYLKNTEVFSVFATETIQVPAAPTGERRQFTFTPASNVGIAIYKYYVFALRDTATKQIVDFKTNHPSLQSYVKARPEKREEILGLAPRASFPEVFK